MAYTKHNFQSGDILYASQLNDIDNAIYSLDGRAGALETNTSGLSSTSATVANNTTRIGTLETTVSGHTSTLNSISGRLDSIDDAIGNLADVDYDSTDIFYIAADLTEFTVGGSKAYSDNVDSETSEHFTMDLNNAFINGFTYLDASGVTNGPTFETQNSKGYMMIFGFRYIPNHRYGVDLAGTDEERKDICQLIVEYPNGRIHTRCYVNGAWSTWKSLATKDEVDNLAARVEALEGNQ